MELVLPGDFSDMIPVERISVVEWFNRKKRWLGLDPQKNVFGIPAFGQVGRPRPLRGPSVELAKARADFLVGHTTFGQMVGSLGSIAPATNYQEQVENDNPVGYYRLDSTINPNTTEPNLGSYGSDTQFDLEMKVAWATEVGGLLSVDTPNKAYGFVGNVAYTRSNLDSAWPNASQPVSIECWLTCEVLFQLPNTACCLYAGSTSGGHISAEIERPSGSEQNYIRGRRWEYLPSTAIIDDMELTSDGKRADASDLLGARIANAPYDVFDEDIFVTLPTDPHHVVLTAENGNGVYNELLSLYLDGVLINRWDYDTPPHYGGSTNETLATHWAVVGARRNTTTDDEWNGVVDEVAYYDYALTAAQVYKHWDAGANGNFT